MTKIKTLKDSKSHIQNMLEDLKPPSKKIRKSVQKERLSTKVDSDNIVEVKMPKKKVKKPKKSVKHFFDEQADEGEESGEDVKIKVNEIETYSKEFLRPKAERLDEGMLDNMLQKYKDAPENDEEEKASHKVKLDEEADLEMEDVSRDICLPSIKDSKLWRIKVTPGRERELVFKITNKLIEYLNLGNPLNVLEVFECKLSPGIIYCEAYKSQHVEKVLQGLSGVNLRSVQMIPINEMTEVMKSC